MRASITLTFPRGYIAHPYWPERERVINIEKASGLNRARSESNRNRALQDYLNAHDMTVDDYEALKKKADRQFYTWEDVEERSSIPGIEGDHADRDADEIVVPAHQLYGCLAQAASFATTSVRLTKPDQLRTVLQIGDLPTGKSKPDGIWDRFVVVTAGAGQKLSNQRALRSNEYIGPFTATTWVRFSEHIVSPQKVEDFIRFAGREIGVGASRKLAWGRFDLTAFEPEV